MTPLPPCGHDDDGMDHGIKCRGSLFNPIPESSKGVGVGTPTTRMLAVDTIAQDGLDWLGEPDPSSLLDPEKHPCNEDDCVDDCRLPDDWPPPVEWQFPPITKSEASFWHSGHQRERKAVFHAYKATGRHRVLHRFVNCGSDVRMFVRRRIGDELSFRIASYRCRDRFCPLCARCKSTIIARNVAALIKERGCRVRMITLTLRHSTTPLKDQLKRLTQSFNNLKRRDYWKRLVVGGVMFIEVKIGRDGLWHVHCHIIAEGQFMPQDELSDEWHCVTGDSPVVDVREICSAEAAAKYVAKYGSKPCDRGVIFAPSRLLEAIAALKGSRLCTTFGEWRGKRLSSPDDDNDNVGWEEVGTLKNIMASEWWPSIVQLRPDLAERVVICLNIPVKPSPSG